VFPSRKKSFVVRFRFRGLPRKLTLGPVLIERNGEAEPVDTPQLGTPLSLAAARELATKALRQAESGTDPCAAKQRARQERLAAESDTLQAISEEYLRRKDVQRTDNQLRSDLELLFKPLGRLPVADIRRGQYIRQLDHIADTRGPVRRDRVLASLNRLLNWHAGRADSFLNPLARAKRLTSIKRRARTRTLSDDELRQVWLAAERDAGPFGAYVRFVLLTATRRSEAAGLRRSELPDDGTTWTIPGARYKSGHDTLIPLSKMAQKIIAAQPELGDFVFTATGKHPLGGFAKRKAQFDKLSGVSGYGLHDLRRTSRTTLSRAGIASDIAERCLGHTLPGIRATYDKHDYQAEKLHAFEALAAQIERIVRPSEAEVADIATERGKRRRK
jgi:integrase